MNIAEQIRLKLQLKENSEVEYNLPQQMCIKMHRKGAPALKLKSEHPP